MAASGNSLESSPPAQPDIDEDRIQLASMSWTSGNGLSPAVARLRDPGWPVGSPAHIRPIQREADLPRPR